MHVTGGQDGSLDPVSDEAVVERAADPGLTAPVRRRRAARLVALVAVVALFSWLAHRDYQARSADAEQAAMVQAARQGMLNLTTIDHAHADTDVQRILDSSTGAFHDDFAQRAQPFIEAARRAQSTSVGTVADAGLEMASGDLGQVLVAMTVMTANRGVPESQPKNWRTRVTVTKADGRFKVAAVEFIP